MIPKAWSHSALNCHDSCPWQYKKKYIDKDLPPEEKSKQQDWGLYVHKQFEYMGSRPDFVLPLDLQIHEPFLSRLNFDSDTASVDATEQKVALSNKPFSVCEYFDKEKPVWWRGVIDRLQVWNSDGRARLVDYKTGKKKEEFDQLAENAIWVFMKYPQVNLINAQFYWVTDQTVSKRVWARSEMDTLVAMFAPKLEAYAHSWKTNVWPKKQSGLCGWCPVKSCEFWWDHNERKHR